MGELGWRGDGDCEYLDLRMTWGKTELSDIAFVYMVGRALCKS